MRIALVQLTSTTEVSQNNHIIRAALENCCSHDVDMVFLPEMCNIMQKNRKKLAQQVSLESEDSTLSLLQDAARSHQTWIYVGSLGLLAEIDGDPPFVNRGFLINQEGEIISRYDKIHLFDATLPDGEFHQESQAYKAGHISMVATTPFGGIGMSICYDLRFPYLYTHLARAGAKILAVPAAFTQQTGKAHWETLLRARAIENACFVIAPAQCGLHEDGRHTFGHSMVISPWGDVLAKAGLEPENLITTIDLAECEDVREAMPVLSHQRPLTAPSLQ